MSVAGQHGGQVDSNAEAFGGQPTHQNGGSNGYHDGSKLEGGQNMSRTITPGGHYTNDDLLAVGAGHRRIANPLPMGAWSFATTTLVLSLYNVGVQGITIPNAIVTYALFYGGFTQYLAGLWEFASGNTLGASIFVTYGMFWWGFSFIFIPFFGEMGTYNGVPGVYSTTGSAAAETDSAIGLFLWIYFGITVLYMFAAARSSIVLITLLFMLALTFGLLGGFYYTGNAALQTAGGAFGIVTAFIAYYLGLGSFLTSDTSYFKVPLGSVAVKD